MNRFIVFGITQYYPCGGLKDVLDSFDHKEEAIKYAQAELDKSRASSSCHIFDCTTREQIWEGSKKE